MIAWLTAPYRLYLPSEVAGVLSAMVWGQTQFLSAAEYQLFKNTGLLHLLVLSGQNITLVIGALEGVLSRLNYRIRFLLNLGVPFFYLLVFFDQPSIIRASLMSILSLITVYRQQNRSNLYIFCLTVFLMLGFNKQWFFSLSFWLSISSTLGIILFYQKLIKQYQGAFFKAVALPLSAQVFSAPLILIFFRELPLLAIPMNILAELVLEPIMVMGILLSLLGQFFPFLAYMVGFCLFGLLKLFLFIINFGNQISVNLILKL